MLRSLTSSQTSFNTSWSYRCIYMDILIQQHVFSIMLTVRSSPPRRCQRVSGARQEGSVDFCFLFKEADPQSCWGQSFAFLILTSYIFIHFQANAFVCVANDHHLSGSSEFLFSSILLWNKQNYLEMSLQVLRSCRCVTEKAVQSTGSAEGA